MSVNNCNTAVSDLLPKMVVTEVKALERLAMTMCGGDYWKFEVLPKRWIVKRTFELLKESAFNC